MTKQRIVILGGTGFVGSHLLPRLTAHGHQVVLLSRHPDQHRALGVIPGVQLRSADIYNDDVLRQMFDGADSVINLVGILNSQGRNTFTRVHVELAARVIASCQACGVSRLHHMSSLKAGQGLSEYLKTRGEAEASVKASPLNWTIYQPSVIFGPGDGLVTRFAGLLRYAPVLPLARAGSRLAPTYVGDVVEAIARCVNGNPIADRHSFELYGPEVLTLGEIVKAIAEAANLRRWIIPLPDSLGRLQAQIAGLLPGKPFSLDNFRSLRTDSVGKIDGYAAVGITPQAFTPWLTRLLGGSIQQKRLDNSRARRR